MTFTHFYTFLGGLGLFFFGMKTLSESLQSMAGSFIRRVINALTSNRFMAVAVGTMVTTVVQSSSVTTVMVVGLVNAGLMELTQAIGVVFGANIGTTITGWIIAVKIGKYGLLLVGLGVFPIIFSKNDRFKNLGRLLLALGFVFMGLETMSGAFKPLKDTEGFQNMLTYFTADNFGSLLACVGIGTLLTCVVQSSSAMLAVTIALGASGAITYQTAVGLVLGENIGTTITALLASVGAGSNAKRAARAHAIFNLLGVSILLPFFWLYIHGIDALIAGSPDALADDGTKPYFASHIAAAHTLFNITATIAFLPFVKHLARLVTWITPAPRKKETPHLKHLPGSADMLAPSLALTAAEKELANLAGLVKRTIDRTKEYMLTRNPSRDLAKKINHYESITDSIQTEITVFVCKTQEARLTFEESALAYSIIRAADELESIADYCASLVRYKDRLDTAGQTLTDDAHGDLSDYLDKSVQLFDDINGTLESGEAWNLGDLEKKWEELVLRGNQIRDNHRKRLEAGQCSPIAGMLFSDMVVALRKLNGHTMNVAENMAGKYDAAGEA